MQTVTSREEFDGEESSNSKIEPSDLTRKTARCGKMILYIRSKQKYMGTHVVDIPTFVPGNPPLLVNNPRRIAIYEDYLDEEQSEAVKNSRMLAANLCIELEVHDLAHSNFFARFLSLFFRSKFIPKAPSLSFENEGLVSLAGSNHSESQNSK